MRLRSIRIKPRPAARPLALVCCLALALILPGCGVALVGGAAAGAAAAVYDRRPYEVIIDDQQIDLTALNVLLQDAQVRGHSGISTTSYNQTVLLTGRAESTEVAQRATLLVSQLPKVKRVIDEITIGPNLDLTRQSEDTYLTSKVKLALTQVSLPGFSSLRVKVVTEDGAVYLLGLVSPEEADAAVEKVRYVPGVKRVVKLFEYTKTPSA